MPVAEWAGHGVNVLLQIYAKCLAGQQEAAMSRIQRVLEGGVRERPRNFDVNVPWMVAGNRVQPGMSAVGKIRAALRLCRSTRTCPCSEGVPPVRLELTLDGF